MVSAASLTAVTLAILLASEQVAHFGVMLAFHVFGM